jgi:hypothetical protein
VCFMPSPNEQVVASGSSAAAAGRAGGSRHEQPRRHTPWLRWEELCWYREEISFM